MKRRIGSSLICGTMGIALQSIGAAAFAQSGVDNEIRNLRALPFGFRTWCEEGHLIFKSPSSARFRISNATLCVGKPDGHVVCATDGKSGNGPADGSVPLCSEISAPGA